MIVANIGCNIFYVALQFTSCSAFCFVQDKKYL